jgi:tetratricopeptide (TPR) repeat protein
MNNYHFLLSKKHWAKLGDEILRRIADSFSKTDDQLFLEFVDLSERNNMLKHNYLELRKTEEETDAFIWLIAVTLERKGAQFVKEYLNSDDMSKLEKAISLYMSSLILEENFIPGYFQLSTALAVKGEVEKSKKYLELGKKVYSKMSASAADLGSYQNAMLQQCSPQYINEFEKGLMQIINSQDSGAL